MKFFLAGVVCALAVLSAAGISAASGEGAVIQDGRAVAMDYTLTVDDKVVDSSKERGPLKFTYGKGEIMEGLSKELLGLKAGEEKNIVINPENGYGSVDPAAFKEYPKKSLPDGQEPQVGMYLQMKSPDGNSFPVRIAEVKQDTVMIDFNHPLAGKTLNFQIKVLSVQ